MAAAGNSFFWLVDSNQSFPLKLLGQRLFRIDQPEKRIACGSHVCNRIGTK
jgi:hypothetical protein